MSNLSDVERELEERFGRPLTAEERAQLHAAAAQGAAPAAADADADADADAHGAADAAGAAPVRGSVLRRAAAPAPPRPTAEQEQQKQKQERTGIARFVMPVVFGALAVAKWSTVIFKVKFLGLFLSIGAFQLLWQNWWVAVGVVVLIFIHELGHMIESRRQGIQVGWPQFIPFLGAYVTLKELPANAWRGATVALAGPLLGGAAAVACWIAAEATGSETLAALAHIGLLLNLFNLAPIGFLDGGRIVDALDLRLWVAGLAVMGGVAAVLHNGILIVVLIVSALDVWSRWKTMDARLASPYYAIGTRRMLTVGVLYLGLAILLVLGMEATDVPRR